MDPPPSVTDAAANDDELSKTEIWWRDHHGWLKENGYTLRPRYTPGWEPSWKDKKGFVYSHNFEDGQIYLQLNVLDATQPDGQRVCLKRVLSKSAPEEANIMEQLSSPPLSADQSNHCVQAYKILPVPDDTKYTVVAMPILRDWYSPPFGTTGEALDFILQLFTAVNFMHKNGFAHRDIKYNNVMMDASSMYPDGFHFVARDRTPDFKHPARFSSRTEKPPKYYLIDFGLAKKYDLSKGLPSDIPIQGGDETAPEFTSLEPCNPFKTDVYCTGNIIKQFFIEGYVTPHGDKVFASKKGFHFLEKLVEEMTAKSPDDRPTMEEVIQRFEDIIKTLGPLKLRSRVAEVDERLVISVAREVVHWLWAAKYIVFSLPAIPSR